MSGMLVVQSLYAALRPRLYGSESRFSCFPKGERRQKAYSPRIRAFERIFDGLCAKILSKVRILGGCMGVEGRKRLLEGFRLSRSPDAIVVYDASHDVPWPERYAFTTDGICSMSINSQKLESR